MSHANGPPVYRLSVSGEVEQRVRALADLARRLGIRDRFTAALRYARAQMTRRPRAWGEQIQDYKQTGWTGHLAVHDLIVVEYAVDPARRIVYLRDIRPMPGTPLDQPEGEP